jgi:4-oxalmesaconate hydratase
VQAPPGVAVGSLVARGEVALGFQQLSELMHLDGIEVVGPMPPGLAIVTDLLPARSARSDAARRGARAARLHPLAGRRRSAPPQRHAAGLTLLEHHTGTPHMIIDCHGHYTTAPKALESWRNQQIAGIKDPSAMPKAADLRISDDELRESIESNQLRLMKERGSDLTLFSPRASFMAHHIGDFQVSSTWAAICNELCFRVAKLFPDHFVPVAMLPQSPGVDPATCIPELEKCVREYGNVGINLNPIRRRALDLAAAVGPPLVPDLREDGRARHPGDGPRQHELQPVLPHDRRALPERRHDRVHAVPDVGPVHGLPDLRFIIPHGGGAVPYHWGRFRGPGAGAEEAAAEGPPAEEHLLRHLRLPPAGHRPADQGDPGRQHPVRERDDRRGARHRPGDRHYYDDTKRYIEASTIVVGDDRHKIYEGNARRVFPRLDAALKQKGK